MSRGSPRTKATATSGVDWKKLKQPRGPATRVPQQVKALVAPDEHARDEAYVLLNGTLYGPGAWGTASAPAVELLWGLLDGDKEGRHRALWLIADVLAGDHEHALATGLERVVRTGEEMAARAAVLARYDTIAGALDHDDPRLRAAAALLLAFLPERADDSIPRLRVSLAREPSESAKASVLLSLGALARQGGAGEDFAPFLSADQPKLVRGGAALASMLADPREDARRLSDPLRAWFEGRIDECVFPWGRPFIAPGAPSRLFLAAAAGCRSTPAEQITEVLLDAVGSEAPAEVIDAIAAVLLVRGGFTERWQREDIALPEDLSPAQRRIAIALARNGIRGVGWGVPSSGRVRRRWLGLEPAGPLERRVLWTVEAGARDWPVWRVWRALRQGTSSEKMPASDGMPAEVRSLLSPPERLIAAAEVVMSAYGIWAPSPRSDADATMIAAMEEAGPDAVGWAESLLDELLVLRGQPHPNPELPPGTENPLRLAAMLCIVRAGRPAKPAWDALVWAWAPKSSAPEAPLREILAALPMARREDVIYRHFADSKPENGFSLRFLIPILDLVPSHGIAEIAVAKLHNAHVRRDLGPDAIEAGLTRVRAIAASEPSVQRALDEAVMTDHNGKPIDGRAEK